jgi:hypothetical protein
MTSHILTAGDEIRFHDGLRWQRSTVVHVAHDGASLLTATRQLWWVPRRDFAAVIRRMAAVRVEPEWPGMTGPLKPLAKRGAK